jgi:hypothetical protein
LATYEKLNLSPGGSESDGNPIQLDTSTTQVHDTGTSATIKDEVWLWATNVHTSDIEVEIAFGYLTSAGFSDADKIIVTIPAKSGLTLLVAGLPVRGTGSALRRVTATAGTASKVNLVGYVNRISS